MNTMRDELGAPKVVDRGTFQAELDTLRVREKAHTREGDAIAAARRRLPMVEVDSATPLIGERGAVTLLDAFEGRRMLIAYYFMWYTGHPAPEQCEGCTKYTSQVHELSYIHARDVTYATFCQGPYEESARYRKFMGWEMPWYSAQDSLDTLLAGRKANWMYIVCCLRQGSKVFETYWTTIRGVEAMDNSYRLLDLTVYGRQEPWEDSPAGWPQRVKGTQDYRTDGPGPGSTRISRPIAQWPRLKVGYSDDLATSLEVSPVTDHWVKRTVMIPTTFPSNHSARASERAFFGISALLFAASAAVTIVWGASMSAMSEMPMPGGWTMSMSWMRMPGQTWPGAAASFLGMWVVMMVAMMLPSLVPMLWRYRQAVGRAGETRLGRLTALVGVGYFLVWTVFGVATFALGVTLAALEMQQPALARAVPIGVGVVVLIAGALQFTAWKAHHLARCRESHWRGRRLPADATTAWRHGLRLGLHCSYCCAGLTAIVLVIGVMDLRAMAVVTATITVERLAPAGERVARAIGAIVVGAGFFLIALALGLG